MSNENDLIGIKGRNKFQIPERDYGFDDSGLPVSDAEYNTWPTPESKNLEKRLARDRFLKRTASTGGLILAIVAINLLNFPAPILLYRISLGIITAIVYAHVNSMK